MRLAGTILLLGSLLLACPAPSSEVPDAGAVDAGLPGSAADGGADAGVQPPPDAGQRADAGTESGLQCTFNADCPADERCECDEVEGCFCRSGVRGTGVAGVDPCTDGNDCESSLCVEGQGGTFYCSGPCVDEGDCGAQLPRCLHVTFIGRICVRQ
jgi:hypothetical protein